MFNPNPTEWAQMIFGQANLGDPRRTKRLVQLTSDMASNTSSSIVKACGSSDKIEGAYRFIRNENISPEDMANAGFKHTHDIMQQRPLVLAIQDTTGLTFKHNVVQELGDVCCSKNGKTKTRTLYAHSTLVLDAHTEQTIGLANQHYFYRDKAVKGTPTEQQNRPFEEKETYRWKACFEKIKAKVNGVSNVIDVCDREADIYEYLDYHIQHKHRFLVRAKENRVLLDPNSKLKSLIETSPQQCSYSVEIKQRGGRKARKAHLMLSYESVVIKKPQLGEGAASLKVNVIICKKKNTDVEDPLCWVLYTNEAINNPEDALKIVRYYELRWRIEEFHKVWKSDGTDVERLRLQRKNNIMRTAIIQAFIAVRLMQLQEIAQNNKQATQINCEECTQKLTWQLLWMRTEKGAPPPASPPSVYWFYYALARLGGWNDSKKNGRVGFKALWLGWYRLMDMVEATELLKALQQDANL
ncbi:IS4 family transposase [Pseudoalteromonas sp. Ld20]|uniref:IS4 family transposase n=1 Tax=Pseudoalteromonas sp. Ld20 TaxID=649165 RepID=UPI0038652785